MLLRRIAAAADDDGGSSSAGEGGGGHALRTACCQIVLSLDSAGGFSMTSAAPRSSPIQTALRAGAPGSARRMRGRCFAEVQKLEAARDGALEGGLGSTSEDLKLCFFEYGVFREGRGGGIRDVQRTDFWPGGDREGEKDKTAPLLEEKEDEEQGVGHRRGPKAF